MPQSQKAEDRLFGTIAFVVVVVVLVGCCFLGFAGCNAVNNFSRTQKRKNAENKVKITTIYVRQQQQEARRIAARDGVVRAQADQRVIQARGIATAQDLIAKTLTPLYVQFEAIQNQANGRGERIYIPVGAQGVPLVANVNGDQIGAGGR